MKGDMGWHEGNLLSPASHLLRVKRAATTLSTKVKTSLVPAERANHSSGVHDTVEAAAGAELPNHSGANDTAKAAAGAAVVPFIVQRPCRAAIGTQNNTSTI